jgi:AbiV family abortive infection protein
MATEFTDRQLVELAQSAFENACDLVREAELLGGSGHYARAMSLGILAIEEAGKSSIALKTLGSLTVDQRTQHERLVAASLKLHMPKLQEMREPLDILRNLNAIFESVPGDGTVDPDGGMNVEISPSYDPELTTTQFNILKQDGFYVGMDPQGRLLKPSEISPEKAAETIAKARAAVDIVGGLLKGTEAIERDARPEDDGPAPASGRLPSPPTPP